MLFDEKHYIHVPVQAFHMGLERIFGDFDGRRGNLPTYQIHFKWTFHVDKTTP